MNVTLSPEDNFICAIYDQVAHSAKIEGQRPEALRRSIPVLTKEQIALLIDGAFWASLGSEEGRTTRVCIAVASPDKFYDAFKLPKPVPFSHTQITKLAPAVTRDGCLLISGSSAELSIWGLGRSRPVENTIVIEISKPGALRVRLGVLRTFAVLNGQSKWILGSTGLDLVSDLQRILQKKFPMDDFIETQAVWRECLALVELARMIVAAGHGGIILIVPAESGEWEKMVSPFQHRFEVPDSTIRDAIREPLQGLNDQTKLIQELSRADISAELKQSIFRNMSISESVWRERQRDLTWATAALAGIDGAIVLTRDLRLLGFGAKINVPVEEIRQIYAIDLIYSGTPLACSLEALGGTRHQSAARFVAASKNTAALVISQDRHTSLMFWDQQSESLVVRRNIEWLM